MRVAILAYVGMFAVGGGGCIIVSGNGTSGAGGSTSAASTGGPSSTASGSQAKPGCYQFASLDVGPAIDKNNWDCSKQPDGSTKCLHHYTDAIYQVWGDERRADFNDPGTKSGAARHDRFTWTALPQLMCPGDAFSWSMNGEMISGSKDALVAMSMYSGPTWGIMIDSFAWTGTSKDYYTYARPGTVTAAGKVSLSQGGAYHPADAWDLTLEINDTFYVATSHYTVIK